MEILDEGGTLLSSPNHFLQVDAICPKRYGDWLNDKRRSDFIVFIQSDVKIQIPTQPDAVLILEVAWWLLTSDYRYFSHIPVFSLTVHK